MTDTASSDLPEMPEMPEYGKTGNRQIPGAAAGFTGTPLGVPETGNRECSNSQNSTRRPQPHEYARDADWPAVLLDRLHALGCEVEADDECLRVSSRGRLPTWEAQLLRTWGDAARKRLLEAALA